MKSERKYPSCTHCGAILYSDNDGYENYFTCSGCAMGFDLNIKPRAMTPLELKSRYGIGLTKREKRASIKIASVE